MAWGSQGQVFLGEDLMHTRDYSEDTSKIIDDEVERILRSEEQRAMEALSKHRGGLNAIARALLDNEIIDGAQVARLVDEAHGSPVHGEGVKSVPHFHEAAISAPAPPDGNGLVTNGANGHATVADTGVDDDGPVVVPAPPVAPTATGRTSESDAWPPPPWPPSSDPASGNPEGPSGD
jgi:hypothetical protein